MSIRLAAIHIHPVKACRRVEVDRVEIGPTGPVGDRRWQVVDGDGRPVTQRTRPVLATVGVEPIDGGLRLTAPDRPTIEVGNPAANDVTVESLVGPPVGVGDGGDEVAAWFGHLTGGPARLVALTDWSERRLPDPIDRWGHGLSFVDAAPVLVASTASLRWLAERASEPFGMDRFRPNLIVEGAEPWAEDTWTEFTVGPARLTAGLPWPRCTVPQVDQDRGDRRREPALVLRDHRWCHSASSLPASLRPMIEGNALFGMACDIGPVGAEVAVGDPVTVVATGPPVLAPPT